MDDSKHSRAKRKCVLVATEANENQKKKQQQKGQEKSPPEKSKNSNKNEDGGGLVERVLTRAETLGRSLLTDAGNNNVVVFHTHSDNLTAQDDGGGGAGKRRSTRLQQSDTAKEQNSSTTLTFSSSSTTKANGAGAKKPTSSKGTSLSKKQQQEEETSIVAVKNGGARKNGGGRRTTAQYEEDAAFFPQPGENGGDENDGPFMFEQTPPFVKNGEMRPYQVRGLNWLIQLHHRGVNGILADEMGLGKTLQTIALLGYLKHYRGIARPFLIVAPKTTLQNWANEFAKWCPSIQTVVLIGDENERKAIIRQTIAPGKFEALITSYEMVLIESFLLKKTNWEYFVIDEGHRIKNEKTRLSQMVRVLRSRHRLLLTGTPLQNNLHELWALLNFLLPEQFADAKEFDQLFITAPGDEEDEGEEGNGEGKGNGGEKQQKDSSVVKRLHAILNQFLLRRLKADVERTLLPKKELKVFVQLTKLQREWYCKLLCKEIDMLNCETGQVSQARLLNMMMQLRKCCNHPYLFPGAEPGPPYTTDEHLIESCAKMAVLDKLLRKLKREGSRVLLFSSMRRMLDIFEDYCWFRDWDCCRLDGQVTSYEERQQLIDEFNARRSKKFIFMLTTRAGGLGINLASADVVIIYDSDWNPQVDLQAMDRCHRIGQTKQVRVFRLVTEATVEERILEMAERKLRLDHIVIQQAVAAAAAASNRPGTSAASSSSAKAMTTVENACSMNRQNLMAMIRHGAREIVASASGDAHGKDTKGKNEKEEDIETILKRAEKKTVELNERMARETGRLENDSGEYSLYRFEGEDYREKLREKEQKQEAEPFFLQAPLPPRRPRKRVNYGERAMFGELTKALEPPRKTIYVDGVARDVPHPKKPMPPPAIPKPPQFRAPIPLPSRGPPTFFGLPLLRRPIQPFVPRMPVASPKVLPLPSVSTAVNHSLLLAGGGGGLFRPSSLLFGQQPQQQNQFPPFGQQQQPSSSSSSSSSSSLLFNQLNLHRNPQPAQKPNQKQNEIVVIPVEKKEKDKKSGENDDIQFLYEKQDQKKKQEEVIVLNADVDGKGCESEDEDEWMSATDEPPPQLEKEETVVEGENDGEEVNFSSTEEKKTDGEMKLMGEHTMIK